MADQEVVLGIDIGGTNTALGLVDREGRCLAKTTLPTGRESPAGAFFAQVAATAARLLDSAGPSVKLVGVGLGAPNANPARRTLEDPPNLAWGYVDLDREFAPHFKVPFAVSNDANAAAVGEMLFGAARGMRDFMVITLGTGLGSGIVVNGELVCGASGMAGELGHIIVDPVGRTCGCGRRGCLETYVSATGLVATVLEWLNSRATPSLLRALLADRITARAVFEAAEAGDALAQEAFEFTGNLLGRKLADAVAFTSPEAIILFGGLAAAGDRLFRPTERSLEDNLMGLFRGTVRLLPAGIQGANAAILGAAALAWKERVEPRSNS